MKLLKLPPLRQSKPEIKTRIKMMPKLDAQHHSSEELNNSVSEIISETQLMSLATMLPGSVGPWINSAYFACDDAFNFYWLSEPLSQHSKNISVTPQSAIAIFNSQQTAAGGKRGLQIVGDGTLATGEVRARGLRAYQHRFAGFENTIRTPEDFDRDIIQSKIYCLTAQMIKIFDEPRFGEVVWIEAIVLR
jgi:uncharacterized protein YhbP (UPF0306 family)